ncbi:MAG: hypothetical protein ACRDHZ_15465 [Ktedonobacteraceae bacterium]
MLTIAEFARDVLGKPLYPYQLEVAEAILESVQGGLGRIITVMMARQAGKNQLSATLEAYLLSTCDEGTIIKAAPTFSPQIATSHERLMRLLNGSALRERVWSNAASIGLAPEDALPREKKQAGPRVLFYSASLESNVMGATAELLLELDEAQDIDCEKFNRDFRPMAAVRNATTVLYGTAWSDTTLLAHQRAANVAEQERGGVPCHFEFNWQRVAAFNPAYRTFVEKEIARLGKEHLIIQTQYNLRSLEGTGYLFNPLQRTLLQGMHPWQEEPGAEDWYVASMDIGGEERVDPSKAANEFTRGQPGRGRRDSTVLSIGRVHMNELDLPCLDVVHQQQWTGKPHLEQYAATLALVAAWNVRCLVVDATGLGEGLASLLADRLGEERVRLFRFSQPSKSSLTYQLLGMINTGRIKLYAPQAAPRSLYEECWQQLRLARYHLPAPDTITMYVNPTDGHDDFLISLALLTETLKTLNAPAISTSIRPKPLYQGEGRF